jgi:hypothetical protein
LIATYAAAENARSYGEEGSCADECQKLAAFFEKKAGKLQLC